MSVQDRNMRPRFIMFLIVAVMALSNLPGYSNARASGAQKPESDFALKDGDRVVFYGDSITEQRLYTTYVEHYVLTHYPKRRVTFINTGWGGDKVTSNDCEPCAGVGGLARIKHDVIDYHPTVVTLLFGMNDGQYKDFDPAIMKVYEDGLSAIIRELKSKTSARIYVMTPTVYDGTRHTPWSHTDRYNDVLDRYSEVATQIARREELPVIDLHTATAEALAQAKKQDPDYTFLPDGVHPAEDGQLLMAAEILHAWGAHASPTELSREANFGASKTVSLMVSAPLPWPSPLPSERMRGVRSEIMDLGRVSLRIPGLPEGSYSLSVDGGNATTYTSDQLRDGIDLGGLSDSAAKESSALAALIRKRADFFMTRWRQIELPYSDYKSTPAVVSAYDSLIAEMTARARTMAGPHKYNVVITQN